MRTFTYKQYITLEDIKNEAGYDLTKRLEQGDFSSKQEAADNYMQDQFEEVTGLISSKMGKIWTKNFLQDILTDADTEPVIEEMRDAFKNALKEHIVYRFEVGDPVAVGDSNTPRYSERMIDILVRNRIIPRGV